MKDLLIYHAGTGTLISLRDKTYLIDMDNVDDDIADALSIGFYNMGPEHHKGIPLDNYNMTNLFFGSDNV